MSEGEREQRREGTDITNEGEGRATRGPRSPPTHPARRAEAGAEPQKDWGQGLGTMSKDEGSPRKRRKNTISTTPQTPRNEGEGHHE